MCLRAILYLVKFVFFGGIAMNALRRVLFATVLLFFLLFVCPLPDGAFPGRLESMDENASFHFIGSNEVDHGEHGYLLPASPALRLFNQAAEAGRCQTVRLFYILTAVYLLLLVCARWRRSFFMPRRRNNHFVFYINHPKLAPPPPA